MIYYLKNTNQYRSINSHYTNLTPLNMTFYSTQGHSEGCFTLPLLPLLMLPFRLDPWPQASRRGRRGWQRGGTRPERCSCEEETQLPSGDGGGGEVPAGEEVSGMGPRIHIGSRQDNLPALIFDCPILVPLEPVFKVNSYES